MSKQTKYVIKDNNNNFYNFITKTWISQLTRSCLSTFAEVYNLCNSLKNTKIQKYILEDIFSENIVDTVLEY